MKRTIPSMLALLVPVLVFAGCQHRHMRHPVMAQTGPLATAENGGGEATPESAAEMSALQARVKGMEGQMKEKGAPPTAEHPQAGPAAVPHQPTPEEAAAAEAKAKAEAEAAEARAKENAAAAEAKAKEDAAAARKAQIEEETRRIRAVLDQMEGKK